MKNEQNSALHPLFDSHTPGPWKYNKELLQIDSEVEWFTEPSEWSEGSKTTVISTYAAMGGKNPNSDITLICAAPELLEVLENILEWIARQPPKFANDPEWIDEYREARSAIAKARGKA